MNNENETQKIDEMISEYLQLKDRKEEIKRASADELEPIEDALKRIENELQRRLQDIGADNFGTKRGTVYLTKKTFTRVADWNMLLDYVKRTDSFDILTKNVAKDAIIQRINESGEVIPGVDITQIQTVGIRRKS